MIKALLARFHQGHRTSAYPAEAPTLPDRFRGAPALDPSRCPDDCRACVEACPTDAIHTDERGLALDTGRCLFCTECMSACPTGAITFTTEYRLAARRRDLVVEQTVHHPEHGAWDVVPVEREPVAQFGALDALLHRIDQDLQVLLDQRIALPRLRGLELGKPLAPRGDHALAEFGAKVHCQPVVLLEPGLRGALRRKLRFGLEQLHRVFVAALDPGGRVLGERGKRRGGKRVWS